MRHYCTLSDRAYLAKLLAMHDSLLRHSSEDFTLHVLVMDVEAYSLLNEVKLPRVELIPLSGFERALNLSEIKKGRTWTEFCWTCASNFMEYLMPWIGDMTYLDADLFFFSDPKVIFDEIGERSIGITPHRFPLHRKHMEVNGRFNVGLVHAKNTEVGRRCVAQWAQQCRDWCYNRIEGSHACGDQKYLDTWEADYLGEVCAISNRGVNLAPWNVEQYGVRSGPTVDGVSVVFYHLHEFKSPDQLTNYPLRDEDRAYIYAPYIAAWTEANCRIREMELKHAAYRREIEMAGQRA